MLSKTLNSAKPRKQESSSLTERIYEVMLQNIVMGEFPHGEFLSELSLAERFKASRTPIREACIRLCQEGFLKVFPHRGYAVVDIAMEEIRDLYQLRRILEPEAAALAAQNSPGQSFFDTCMDILKDQARAMTGERSYELFLESSGIEYQFHHTIALGSGNKKLGKMVSDVMNQFRRIYYAQFQRSPWLPSSLEEHRKILEAIRNENDTLARELMFQHIDQAYNRSVQSFLGPSSQEKVI